jgi:energy-converting hydrogenase B subunit D
MVSFFNLALLLLLVTCAMFAARIRDLLSATILFSAYSLIMAILWMLLGAPDIAITEAAIGAGVTSILFVVAIHKTRRME